MVAFRRVFDETNHEKFVRLSSDRNPIHVDEVATRRIQGGARIVHGIHSLIWVIDCFSRSDFYTSNIRRLKVSFQQPIYVGEEATLEFSRIGESGYRGTVRCGLEDVVVATFGLQDSKSQSDLRVDKVFAQISQPDSPRDPSLNEIEQTYGKLSFGASFVEIAEMFPDATKAFGLHRVAALASSSCLVGMIVPGLHSLFLGLEVSLCSGNDSSEDSIYFSVCSVSRRFHLVRIGIQGPGLRGILETQIRSPPVEQRSMNSLLNVVPIGAFNGSRALVIGGSRGLGELTAKLLAGGGADVTITYRKGQKDADIVVQEIKDANFKCTATPCDVLEPESMQSIAKIAPTHIYYFATPPISKRKSGLFDLNRFREFNSFYSIGLFSLVQACIADRREGLKVFVPSTIYIENRPALMTEYAMSKAAAEILCADISRFLPGVHIITRRLPRLPTDQTNSIAHPDHADSVETVLPIVLEMQSPN